MSNKHRKHRKANPTTKPKQTIEEFFRKKMREIQKLFPDVPMRVTIIARYPPDPEAEIVFSDDQFDHVIALMQRRRDAVVAMQEAAKGQPEEAAP